MVQQLASPANGVDTTLKEARSAFKRLRAGIRLSVQQDYGDYTETITELVTALNEHGVEGVHKAYSVLKRVSPQAAQLEWHENPYPLDLDLTPEQLAYIDRLPYTDFGQAEALAYCYRDRLRFAVGLGWLVWSGLRWQPDTRRAIVQIAGVVARARQLAVLKRHVAEGDKDSENAKVQDLRITIKAEAKTRLDAAISIAETDRDLVHDVNELDQDPDLLGVKNGIVDLRTGRLIEADPAYLITKRNDIDYIPDAPCPRWERFLREVFADNTGLIDYFHRAVGYSLTGLTHEHCFWIMYGSGRNGKGTINWALEALAGEYGTDADPKVFEAKKESGTGEELAILRGARLVLASETQDGYRLNEARIKALTGEDTISARHLYGRRFTFRPTFKVWLATNHKPVIQGADIGIWSRPKLLPFTVSFLGREDHHLKRTLAGELPGILAWAVRGAQLYYKHGLKADETVTAATEAYRSEMDVLGQWMEERLQEEPKAYLNCSDAHRDYKSWAEDQGLSPVSQPRLSRALVERGWQKEKKSDGWYWLGYSMQK